MTPLKRLLCVFLVLLLLPCTVSFAEEAENIIDDVNCMPPAMDYPTVDKNCYEIVYSVDKIKYALDKLSSRIRLNHLAERYDFLDEDYVYRVAEYDHSVLCLPGGDFKLAEIVVAIGRIYYSDSDEDRISCETRLGLNDTKFCMEWSAEAKGDDKIIVNGREITCTLKRDENGNSLDEMDWQGFYFKSGDDIIYVLPVETDFSVADLEELPDEFFDVKLIKLSTFLTKKIVIEQPVEAYAGEKEVL